MKALVKISRSGLLGFIEASEAWLQNSGAKPDFQYVHDAYDEMASSDIRKRDKARERADRGIVQARLLLDLARRTSKTGDEIPGYYQKQRSGRLYGEGVLNLQRCMREVRRAALRGCFDVDLNNAHWSLLSSMCRRIAFPTPCIDAYILDRRGTRVRIARETGLNQNQVKKVLILLIYGSRLVASPFREDALQKQLGDENARRVIADETVRELFSELTGATAAVTKNYRDRSSYRG